MTTSSLADRLATPLHDKIWVAVVFDNEPGKLWAGACACSWRSTWSTDSTLAMPEARAHRDDERRKAG